jgi:hypothetical protein
MKYKLEVKPAIPVSHRHKLQDALEELGYNVWAGGTHMDMSACDIAFEAEDDGEEEKRRKS